MIDLVLISLIQLIAIIHIHAHIYDISFMTTDETKRHIESFVLISHHGMAAVNRYRKS